MAGNGVNATHATRTAISRLRQNGNDGFWDAMTKPGNDWIASWRLTRRQLEQVARGELPRTWITWARRDLAAITDPAMWFINRLGPVRERRPKR